ncbi:hypothetical protein [Kitasatospora purpeofusca]|uniref:hypothetical protein n=1 Tax=Kitasatospora purpeofusca TaxID=67352 RepID=UPI002A59C607|nr:hypothetical protein [Kitasatospora purpeofusca]MDY0811453.1 hypothetical protein [Kitasatospora purpeofusca]
MASVTSNAAVVAAQLEARAAVAVPAAAAVVRHHAMLLETAIRAAASGRPGPGVQTGDYRRSWTTEVRASATGVEAIVGTSRPQGPRLEYGFVGRDSLGRVFHQPPFPHVGPSVERVEPLFLTAMGRVAEQVVAG